MTVIENYKGIDIAIGIVCYDVRYFVMNKIFVHFATIEEAREDIDNTILKGVAYDWITQNNKYLKDIEFTHDELIQIGKNVSNMHIND